MVGTGESLYLWFVSLAENVHIFFGWKVVYECGVDGGEGKLNGDERGDEDVLEYLWRNQGQER